MSLLVDVNKGYNEGCTVVPGCERLGLTVLSYYTEDGPITVRVCNDHAWLALHDIVKEVERHHG